MSSAPAPVPPAPRSGLPAAWAGLRAAWTGLDVRRRRAAAAVLLVLLSLLLPWYSKGTTTLRGPGALDSSGGSVSGYAGLGFIEASLLVVLVAVLGLLWARGRQKRFALPFDDGTVICAAAGWMGALIVYRFFALPSGSETATERTFFGLSWGIVLSLLAVAVLFVAGWDLRRHGPRTVRPGEAEPAPEGGPPAPSVPDVDPATVVVGRRPEPGPDAAPTNVAPRRPAPAAPADRDQPSLFDDDRPTEVTQPSLFDAPPTEVAPRPASADDAPTRVSPRQPRPAPAPTEASPRRPRPPAPRDPDGPVHEWPSRMRRPDRDSSP